MSSRRVLRAEKKFVVRPLAGYVLGERENDLLIEVVPLLDFGSTFDGVLGRQTSFNGDFSFKELCGESGGIGTELVFFVLG